MTVRERAGGQRDFATPAPPQTASRSRSVRQDVVLLVPQGWSTKTLLPCFRTARDSSHHAFVACSVSKNAHLTYHADAGGCRGPMGFCHPGATPEKHHRRGLSNELQRRSTWRQLNRRPSISRPKGLRR